MARMEYMNLLPWKRFSKNEGDEELGMDEDDISCSGSHHHRHLGIRTSFGSTYSLNEGDLEFLTCIREESSMSSHPNLIDESDNISTSGTGNNTKLLMAIEEKDINAVEFCLRNGADPNAQFGLNKTTALHLATAQGIPEAVRLLLRNGKANVRSTDLRGVTALHLAAGTGDVGIIRLLVEAGADLNARDGRRDSGFGGETPLHRAAIGGHLDALRALVTADAHVNVSELRGRTPLHYAAQRGATGCIQTLLQYDADPNITDLRGTTALLLLGGSYLMKGHRRLAGYSESVEVLVKGGAKVNVKDPDSEVTPLHQAVTLGRLEAVRTLLTAGAEVHAKDREGVTPIHVASLKGHSSILKLLLAQPGSKEAVDSCDTKGRTALHKASYRGSVDCIQLLLRAGADLGCKTKSGVSAASLILQLPTGPKILGQKLDESITTNNVDPNEFACRLKFDYSILLPRHKYQQMSIVEDILDESSQRKSSELLQHPVVESFLFLKWRKIRLLFFSNVIFYLILVAGVTAYVMSTVNLRPTEVVEEPTETDNSTVNARPLMENGDPTSSTLSVSQLRYSLNIIILIILLQEVIQIFSLHVQYFREAESWIKCVALVTSTIVIFLPTPWPDWVRNLSAVAVLFGWTEVTLLLGRLPSFGVYALMFYSVAENLVKFILVFLFFLAGFAFSFHIIFGSTKDSFASPWTSLIRTFAMMLGDASYDDYMVDGTYLLPGTSHLIYTCFLVLVSLILMNLLIGLAVNDIQGLQKEGRVKRLRKQAQFIVYLEDIANNRFLRFILRDKITRKLNGWINQSPTFITNPALRQKNKIRLPSSLIEHALSIVQLGRIPVDHVTTSDTYNLVHECIASIDALRQRIENLERGLVGSSTANATETASNDPRHQSSDDVDAMLSEDDAQHTEDTEQSSSDIELNKPAGDYDQIDGAPRKSLSRSKSHAKRSLRSDLDEIKRLLTALTSNDD